MKKILTKFNEVVDEYGIVALIAFFVVFLFVNNVRSIFTINRLHQEVRDLKIDNEMLQEKYQIVLNQMEDK